MARMRYIIMLVRNYRPTARLSERFSLEEEFLHLVEPHFRLFLFGRLSNYLIGRLIQPILKSKTR
jgi:hypothetical protein